MKKWLLSTISAAGLCSCAVQQQAPPGFDRTGEAAVRKIESRLPKNWKVVQRGRDSAPAGIAELKGSYFLELEGPRARYLACPVNGIPTTTEWGRERVRLWVMPTNFVVKKPGLVHALSFSLIPVYSATEASSNELKLFSEFTETPSWPNWGADIYKALDVRPKEP